MGFFISILWGFVGIVSAVLLLNLLSAKTFKTPNLLLASSNVSASPIDRYKAAAAANPTLVGVVGTDDARPYIVDNFLAKHRSPMVGMGKTFVFVADRYGIDWKLLPAIAFQESNLGKKIPTGSYNAFGWAVFTGANKGASFEGWGQAIDTVARGIKEKYISKGLTTPEAIMTRYTPNSDGSWAFAVRYAMDEMVQ